MKLMVRESESGAEFGKGKASNMENGAGDDFGKSPQKSS